ncbi:MAG: hypothetical protein PVI26_10165 [Chitinispirillia bacterium]|jgi:hypothetical protein
MYLSSTISVNPSQKTLIERTKPTKVFAKILSAMTAGLSSKKEEVETFTAVSILQELNRAFRSLKIMNIVRLSKDELNFYFDEEGKDDDLQEVMEEFDLELDPIESEFFKTITMVLEHEDEMCKYLIEIDISRQHDVGAFPIILKINGFIKQLGKNGEDLKNKVFSSQENYEAFIRRSNSHFEAFSDQISMAIKKVIKCDEIKTENKLNIIRTKERIKDMNAIPYNRNRRDVDPVYYGYYGFNTYFVSALLWTDMLYSHNIYCHDMTMMDSNGQQIMEVGNEGFHAGESNTLNVNESFEPPESGDIEYFQGSDFDSEIEGSDVSFQDSSEHSDKSSFFDFGGESEDWGGSGSSCSSCSSCGGCGSD